MNAPSGFHYRSRDPVQHREAVASIFHVTAGNDEYRSPELWDFDLPLPSQVAYFAVPAARIDGEQGHLLKMRWQFAE